MSITDLLVTAILTPVWARGEDYLAYQGPMGLPVVLRGSPGEGKSACINQVGELLEMRVHTFAVESADVEDFNGMVVNVNGNLRRLSDNHELHEIMAVNEGIIFLDETNTNPSKNLNAALNRILLDRLWLKTPMPPGVRVLGAMNPPHLSAGGRALPASTLNRLCIVDFPQADPVRFSNYINTTGREATIEKDQLRQKLADTWVSTREAVSMVLDGFFNSSPQHFNAPPTVDNVHLNRPFPTPRAWHSLRNFLTTARCLELSTEDTEAVVHGCVGEGVGSELSVYMRKNALPRIQDVLSGAWHLPKNYPIDAVYSVTQGCLRHLRSVAFFRDSATQEQMAYHALEFCSEVSSVGLKDLIFDIVTYLGNHGYGLKYALSAKSVEEKKLGNLITTLSKQFDTSIYTKASSFQVSP